MTCGYVRERILGLWKCFTLASRPDFGAVLPIR